MNGPEGPSPYRRDVGVGMSRHAAMERLKKETLKNGEVKLNSKRFGRGAVESG